MAFFSKLNTLIFNWKDPLPDVREIFRPREIDELIIESMKCVRKPGLIRWPFITVVKFLIKTGYEDEPELDEDGEVILLRTTPLHYAASDVLLFGFAIGHLFRIYPRFDTNYASESGLTHLHVACMFKSCERFVKEFLDHGQDSNLPWRGKGETPLHLVAQWGEKEIIHFLLMRGADPQLSNAEGETALHDVCKRSRDDLVEMFLKVNKQFCKSIDIDAVDDWGRTPLLVALNRRDKKSALLLLKKGANPNAANEMGFTALHLMCRRNYDSKSIEEILDAMAGNCPGTTAMHCISRRRLPADDLAKTLLRVCGEIDRVVQIDFKDKRRRTPLEWAVANHQPQLVERLLQLDDDLSGFRFPSYTHFDQCFEWHAKRRVGLHRLKLASGVLACLEPGKARLPIKAQRCQDDRDFVQPERIGSQIVRCTSTAAWTS
ncbi:ankyrin-3-like [Trichogramma pretiosum]|uniref:ankyrin-3-like n=1 Tax=Trichogramma pretiosum TaxID=7493 RepID=UPI000C71C847|nr:ankyrin-3-like [Trichogramma pretiosum]